jgi:hypothetical protein
MTDYVSGVADLDTILNEIDASWPRKISYGRNSVQTSFVLE